MSELIELFGMDGQKVTVNPEKIIHLKQVFNDTIVTVKDGVKDYPVIAPTFDYLRSRIQAAGSHCCIESNL